MLRIFRVRALCFITALFLAAGTTAASFEALLHASDAHDAACVKPADVTHDASRHRFTSPADDVDGHGHCVACHLARAPRIGAQAASAAVHAAEARAPRPIPAIGSARAAALASLPPRSPPSLS